MLRQELEARDGIARCLAGLGAVAIAQGDPARGLRLCGAAQARIDALGLSLDPAQRAHFERSMAAARTQLDERDFNTLWQVGQSLSVAQAIEEAVTVFKCN